MAESLHVVCPACNAVNRVPAARLAQDPVCGACGQPVFRQVPVELDSHSFERHLSRSDIPLLVDFWAAWCAPCRMMAPAYEQVAQRLEPHVRVAKLNTEQAPGLAARYAIRSIPTLALFRKGREVARRAGAMDAGGILGWVRQHGAIE